MTDHSEELKNSIKQLIEEGKKPTVALVKSRLTTIVPVPVIISAIHSFSPIIANSAQLETEISNTTLTSSSINERITQLEQQMAALLKRIDILEKQHGESL